MKTRELMFAGMTLFFFLSASLLAQKSDTFYDQYQVPNHLRQLSDDRQEFFHLTKLINQRERLIDHRAQPREIAALERRILIAVQRDFGESARKLKQLRYEVNVSRSECKDFNKQNYRDSDRFDYPGSVGYSRDLRGDHRDLVQLAGFVDAKRDIVRQLERMQTRHGIYHHWSKNSTQKDRLYRQYLQIDKRELELSFRELKKDRRDNTSGF